MRYVYLFENRINGKVYVGQTRRPMQRKAGHFYGARSGKVDSLLARAIRKHGEENFEFRIIEECSEELINERETFWIAHFDSTNREKGYNLESGGGVGKEVHEETRRKLSEMFSGEGNPMFGKSPSITVRETSSQTLKRLNKVKEFQWRQHENNLGFSGKKHSDETKKRMSVSRRRLSDEQVAELREFAKSGMKSIDLAHRFGVSRSFVDNVIAGRRR